MKATALKLMRRRPKRPRLISTRLICSRMISIITEVRKMRDGQGDKKLTEETLGASRFSINPRVMGGKPCVRGTRVTVETISGLVTTGHSEDEILALYPYIEREDVRAVVLRVSDGAEDAASWRGRTEEESPERPAEKDDSCVAVTQASLASPEVQKIVEAALALPEEERERLLVAIIVSLEEGDEVTDAELERLWSELVDLKRRRAVWRARTMTEKEAAQKSDEPGPEARAITGKTLCVKIKSTRYPLSIEGSVDGLPFVLIEEGETWRFAASPEPAIDPRSVTSNRNGFIVTGLLGLDRVHGEAKEMSESQVIELIGICIDTLRAKALRGRGPGARAVPTKSGKAR